MSNNKKQRAKYLFISTELYRKEIAMQVGVTEKTLRSWINDPNENWEAQKESKQITRTQLLQDAYAQLKAVNKKINEEMDGVPNKELSDAKGVLRKEIEALTDMPLHKYVEVSTELIEWTRKNEPKILLDVLDVTDKFINHLAKGKGI